MTLELYIVSALFRLYQKMCLKMFSLLTFPSRHPHLAVSLSGLTEWQGLRLPRRMGKPLPEMRDSVQRCGCLTPCFRMGTAWTNQKKMYFSLSCSDTLICTNLLQTRLNTAATLKTKGQLRLVLTNSHWELCLEAWEKSKILTES